MVGIHRLNITEGRSKIVFVTIYISWALGFIFSWLEQKLTSNLEDSI